MTEKKEADTSITVSAANKHYREADAGQELHCNKNRGFFLLKQAKNCAWRLRYTDANGKRRKVTLGKLSEINPRVAAFKARELTSGITDGKDPLVIKEQRKEQTRKRSKQTVEAFLDGIYTKHQERKKGGGKHTLQIIRSNFPDFMKRSMESLSKNDIREWQQKKESDNKKRSTIERAYGALKTMLKYANQEGYIDTMPLQSVSLKEPPATEEDEIREKSRRMLTPEEISALLSAVDAYNQEKREQRQRSRAKGKTHLADLDDVAYAHWFVPYFHVALHLGMRPGDLYTLDWSHVNLTFKRLLKKLEKTKHHNEPTVLDLPLNDTVLDVLTKWHEQQGKPKTGLVFPSPINGKQMDKLAHRKSWNHVKTLAGDAVPDNLVFYSLRHHFISALVSANVPMLVVAKLAGHKGTKMIEQHYGHLSPSDAANAMAALGASLTQSEPHQTNELNITPQVKGTV